MQQGSEAAGGGGPAQQGDGFLAALPADPGELREPYIYLARHQHATVRKHPPLACFADRLPGWVPQRCIAAALGHGPGGMQRAMESLGGRPYVWATEFENVHSLWRYREPQLVIGGVRYGCSEEYFHAQKPRPFCAELWNARRVEVMRTAVRAKYAADRDTLRPLLLATRGYPLLSVKSDAFWGFDPHTGGENMLARLWEELRAKEAADAEGG
eukprot:TRINITY_DN42639_c0_g1_i1.p1 TRINITY_DN42639_c0_g1~~TRINITY_DN42639_c0_g1_i1.p1  ORF type:complete len:238 (+),score=33.25 TRINITY_DN42639_c0_g1_i1:77-715(+)